MTAAHHRFDSLDCQERRFGLTVVEWALLLFSLAVLVARWLMLNQTSYANGLDGYYYAEQIRALRQLGHLIIVDNSPVLYFMGLLDFGVGNPVATTKLCSALFAAFGCLAIYYFVRSARGQPSQGLLAAILFGISPTLSFMSVDYIKNCGALVIFLVAAGWTATWFRNYRINFPTVLSGLILFALCYTAHRVSAGLLGLFVLGNLLQKGKRWLVGSLVLCLILAGIVGLLSLTKGGFLLADLSRIFPAFMPGPGLAGLSPTFRQALPMAVVLELSLACITSLGLWVHWNNAKPGWRALWPGTVILFLPIWDLSVLDLGFRLQSNGVALVIALLAMALPALSNRWLPVLLAVGLTFLPLDRAVYRLDTDPPFRLYQTVTQNLELPTDSLLICHPGLNNYYTYTHDLKDALAFLPEFTVATDKLWRLSYGVELAEYRRTVPEGLAAGLITKLASPYILIREDVFQEFRRRLDPERRENLDNWFNPHQLRPLFLLEKNR